MRGSGRIRPLAVADVERLDRCPGCPDPDRWTSGLGAAVGAWGWCGLALSRGEETLGHLLLVPQPARDDAGLEARLLALHPAGDDPRGVVGRRLLEGAAARLRRRSVVAVEAEGHRRTGDCAHPPAALLSRRGFVVVGHHPVHPRMRLELRTTVLAPGLLAPGWRRLTELVADRPPPPEPVGFATGPGRDG